MFDKHVVAASSDSLALVEPAPAITDAERALQVLEQHAIASGCLIGTYERHDTSVLDDQAAAAAVLAGAGRVRLLATVEVEQRVVELELFDVGDADLRAAQEATGVHAVAGAARAVAAGKVRLLEHPGEGRAALVRPDQLL